MADEFEAKFRLDSLDRIRARLQSLGGRLAVERHLERNWRFDLADGNLTARGAVLRLRLDPGASLEFKQPTERPEHRQEFGFGLEDAEAARAFLQALGFQQIGYYEKQREIYRFEDGQVMLDELPFGHFVELEGPSAAWLRHTADRLGLSWDRRVRRSYLELFEALRGMLERPVEQASFAAFADLLPVDLGLLGLRDAGDDRGSSPQV